MVDTDAVTEIVFDQVISTAVRQFDQYWQSKRQGSALPRRLDIDPSELPKLLPFFILTDIEHTPFRVRYRLCGSLVAAQDEELTGKYVDELQNTSAATKAGLLALYVTACRERRPVYARVTIRSRQTALEFAGEGAVWPLSSDGIIVDKCAAIQEMVRG